MKSVVCARVRGRNPIVSPLPTSLELSLLLLSPSLPWGRIIRRREKEERRQQQERRVKLRGKKREEDGEHPPTILLLFRSTKQARIL